MSSLTANKGLHKEPIQSVGAVNGSGQVERERDVLLLRFVNFVGGKNYFVFEYIYIFCVVLKVGL